MSEIRFGHRCEECEDGTVVARHVKNYATKIRGYPFVVDDAIIGVCDACGTEYFDSREVDRWEREFEDAQYLDAEEITALRERLGFPREQLALLIGCTRQSIYNWENADRSTAQSWTFRGPWDPWFCKQRLENDVPAMTLTGRRPKPPPDARERRRLSSDLMEWRLGGWSTVFTTECSRLNWANHSENSGLRRDGCVWRR